MSAARRGRDRGMLVASSRSHPRPAVAGRGPHGHARLAASAAEILGGTIGAIAFVAAAILRIVRGLLQWIARERVLPPLADPHGTQRDTAAHALHEHGACRVTCCAALTMAAAAAIWRAPARRRSSSA